MQHPAVASETVLERLSRLHPKLIDLGLGRMQRLLAALGNPERHLPPVIHVAGTNGKGSTCAFARAIIEAAGRRAHVYISPHLVRFHERIRLAGRLVDEPTLYATLLEVEAANGSAPITFFEITTACAFQLFARTPADAVVLEVGLGGRLDATNVLDRPAATAITSIGQDHTDWLGERLADIAREKCGILRPGVPAITGAQPAEAREAIAEAAAATGARLLERGRDWQIAPHGDGLRWEGFAGTFDLPRPSLPGPHQLDNAGIAIGAVLASGVLDDQRAAGGIGRALTGGLARAEWPARLQRLRQGPLVRQLPPGWELWLDGGHNPAAGAALAAHASTAWQDRPLHAVIGMKQGKGVAGFIAALAPCCATLWAVAEAGQHLAMPVEEIIAAAGGRASAGPTLEGAIAGILQSAAAHGNAPARVLIAGSLYLAALVLADHG